MHWGILSFLSALSVSGAAFTEKKTLASMRSLAFSLRTSFIVAVVSIAALPFLSFSALTLPIFGIIIVSSVIGAAAYLRVTHGVKRLEVGEAAPLLLLSPAITAVLAFIILGESLGPWQVGGMTALIIGTYVLVASDVSARVRAQQLFASGSGARYVIEGVGLYAVSAIFDRIILSRLNIEPLSYLAMTQIIIAAAMTLYALAPSRIKHLKAALALPSSACATPDSAMTNAEALVCYDARMTSRREWLGTLAVAALTILNRGFFLVAASMAPIGPVTAIRRSSALITTAIDGRQGGTRAVRRIIACIVMLAGVYMITR